MNDEEHRDFIKMGLELGYLRRDLITNREDWNREMHKQNLILDANQKRLQEIHDIITSTRGGWKIIAAVVAVTSAVVAILVKLPWSAILKVGP